MHRSHPSSRPDDRLPKKREGHTGGLHDPVLLDIPTGPVAFHRLVLDFTGTLSLDGELLPGVGARLERLAGDLEITVLTADTFGTAREALTGLPIDVRVIRNGEEKAQVVAAMGPGESHRHRKREERHPHDGGRGALHRGHGTGRGLSRPPGHPADIVTRDINDALDLLLHPLRLKATLRD